MSPSRRLLTLLFRLAIVSIVGTGAIAVWLTDPRTSVPVNVNSASMPGEPSSKHPTLADPVDIAENRAESIYRAIVGQLESTYALSDDPVAHSYTHWRRFNRYPYRSAHHGERFVNNYGNDLAKSYGEFERAGKMPVGAMIAKDGFVVTRDGTVLFGPLALMEKMPSGFDAGTGDWRYMMIDETGMLVGMTKGPNADRMRACEVCHARAPEGQDRLYFLPVPARVSR